MAMALFCMGDLYVDPVSEIQYVLAHENETGYRGNGSKYGAYYFRDNYLYTIDFCANKPYRLKIRPPGFAHMAALDELSRGHMLADAVMVLSTLDIVFGDVDR